MANKPFRMNDAAPVAAAKEAAAPVPGKFIVQSQKTGERLPDGRQDMPDHDPLIAWPQPALGVDRKPMKVK